MLAKRDLRNSKKISIEKFRSCFNKGIDKKENFDYLIKLIEKAEFRGENNLILDFLFNEYLKSEGDLLKYRILKLGNRFLYGKQDFIYYLSFKEKIFDLLLSNDGNVRYNSTHLVNNLRSHLLINSDVDLVYFKDYNYNFTKEEKNEMRKLQNLMISSFFELIEIYEKLDDEKIKINILKSIEYYYCDTMDNIIEGTSQEKVNIYNRYSEIIYGKEEFEEVDENAFEDFLKITRHSNGFVFDYENCNDNNKLKKHIKELRELISDLIEESGDLDEYIAELENKVKTLE